MPDITPLSLGEDLHINGIFTTHVVIPRNTPIPTVKSSFSRTRRDNQNNARIIIRQGESSRPEQNHLLGEFQVSGFPEDRAGSIKFETVFEINADGILSVNCTEKSSGKTKGIVVTKVNGQSRKRNIDEMIQNAKKNRLDEEIRKEAIRARNALEDECYKIGDSLLQGDENISESKRAKLRQKCNATLRWLEDNPNKSPRSYETCYNEITTIFEEID